MSGVELCSVVMMCDLIRSCDTIHALSFLVNIVALGGSSRWVDG